MDLLKKLFLAGLLLLIVFFFVWAAYAPKKDMDREAAKTLEEQKDRLDLYFKGVTFQETQGAVKYWEIKAASSSINKSTGVASIEQADGTFFRDGKPVLKFISPLVHWNMDRKEIALDDPIGYDLKAEPHINELLKQAGSISTFILPARSDRNSEGFFFKAKQLSWKLKTEKLICVGGIYLKKGEMAGMADKLESDVGLEKVNIFGSPCVINLINASITSLEASNFLVDSVNDIISATGGIRLTADGFKLTADNVEFRQREDTLSFRPLVQISYLGTQAVSRLASYNIKSSEINMTDNARLVRGGSTLTGDSVKVSLKNKTFKVTGKTRIVIPDEEIK